MSKYKNILSELIVTCFFIGKIKFAPGTWGSLFAFPVIYMIDYVIVKGAFLIPIEGWSYVEQRFVTIFVATFSAIAFLSIIGVIASNYYMKQKGSHDPSEIVIDEVVGQMLTSALTMLSIVFVYNSELGQHYKSWVIDLVCFFVLPFVLFRACDIIKPWPIKWMDKNIKGGIGVMLDDIAAAFMASVLQYAIIFAVIG